MPEAAEASPPPATARPAPGSPTAPRARPRMAVRRQVEGAHVRLGVAWFVLLVASSLVASVALGILLGVAAALAAAQVARIRLAPSTSPGGDADPTSLGARVVAAPQALAGVLGDLPRLAAALAGASLPLAAVAGTATVTAAAAAVALVVALTAPLPGEAGPGRRLETAAAVVAPALAFGVPVASVVLVREEGVAAAVVLVLLVSAYEVGDFLVGTGSATVWEGPVAGVAAVAVVALGASLLALVPLGGGGPLVLAGIVAVAAPAGPPIASVLIGDGTTSARFARRLDAWLVVGPVGAWATAAMAS